jgi:hypothetical protein
MAPSHIAHARSLNQFHQPADEAANRFRRPATSIRPTFDSVWSGLRNFAREIQIRQATPPRADHFPWSPRGRDNT